MMRSNAVGLSLRLQLDWLEHTAMLQLNGASEDEIRDELHRLFQDTVLVGVSSSKHSSHRKVICNLMKIWVTVPSHLETFRDEGLQYLQKLPLEQHLPIHWGMTTAVYPFFQLLTETVGRLLNLQDTITSAQVCRRVQEQIGDRSTVARATQRGLRTLINWKVLQDTKEKGVYKATSACTVNDGSVTLWLIEAALIASEVSSIPLRFITKTPSLFPFQLDPLALERYIPQSRLEVSRQGLDDKVVALRIDQCKLKEDVQRLYKGEQ